MTRSILSVLVLTLALSSISSAAPTPYPGIDGSGKEVKKSPDSPTNSPKFKPPTNSAILRNLKMQDEKNGLVPIFKDQPDEPKFQTNNLRPKLPANLRLPMDRPDPDPIVSPAKSSSHSSSSSRSQSPTRSSPDMKKKPGTIPWGFVEKQPEDNTPGFQRTESIELEGEDSEEEVPARVTRTRSKTILKEGDDAELEEEEEVPQTRGRSRTIVG